VRLLRNALLASDFIAIVNQVCWGLEIPRKQVNAWTVASTRSSWAPPGKAVNSAL
jgi:hypothetical protein